jgi:co-chaperonin GroES (HSP10)
MNLTEVQAIRPLGDLVIVRRHKQELYGGAIIVPESLSGLQKGTVVAVGPGLFYPHSVSQRVQGWRWMQCLVQIGDVVLYLEGTGQPLRQVKDRFVTDASDRQYLIMHESHIAGVLERE